MKTSELRLIIREKVSNYKDFFKQTCKKFGIKPNDIDKMSDEKKKKFFNYIDKNWNSKSEPGKDGIDKKKNEAVSVPTADNVIEVGINFSHLADALFSDYFKRFGKRIATNIFAFNKDKYAKKFLDTIKKSGVPEQEIYYEAKNLKNKKLNEKIEFDFVKTLKLIKQEEFLRYIYNSTSKGSDKQKAENIFKDHVLGNNELEKKYNKI